MVVRLHLDQGMNHFIGKLPGARRVVWCPEVGQVTLEHGSIIAIGGDGEVRCLLVGVLDHLEQALAHGLAVDGPGCIEDLVATMSVWDRQSEIILKKETRLFECGLYDTCHPL